MISPNRECSSFPIKIKIDKADVGLENVDNTSDLDKPISNAVRDYIDNVNSAIKKAVTVDTTQNITGAKTFAGETTITGPLGVSGDTALTGKVTVEKELNVDSNGFAKINGPLTASNTANTLKVANHDTVLTSNDVLSAKDINEVNGSANNLLHRSGNEATTGTIQARKLTVSDSNPWLELIDTGIERGINPSSWRRSQLRVTDKNNNLLLARWQIESLTGGSRIVDIEAYENSGAYFAALVLEITTTGTANLVLKLVDNQTSTIIKSSIIATLSP